MGLQDRDYLRNPPPGARPSSGRIISFDGGLLLGILLIAIGFGALIFNGFKVRQERDELLAELAAGYDPHFNGGYPLYDINTITEDELVDLPWMEERIAKAIVERREKKPFRLTQELFEIPGVSDINIEMFRLYLFGFEDSPIPSKAYNRTLGIPDA